MLIEPTETESKATLDQFIECVRSLAERRQGGRRRTFLHDAPHLTPRRRLDETLAARKPVLRWKPPRRSAQGRGVSSPRSPPRAVSGGGGQVGGHA